MRRGEVVITYTNSRKQPQSAREAPRPLVSLLCYNLFLSCHPLQFDVGDYDRLQTARRSEVVSLGCVEKRITRLILLGYAGEYDTTR